VESELIFSTIPTTRDKLLSQHDAELLRKYKQFLMKYGLKESLWCLKCDDAGQPSGLKAYVTDGKIDFECRCTVRRYRGQTY
jgi:hypothetical protein